MAEAPGLPVNAFKRALAEGSHPDRPLDEPGHRLAAEVLGGAGFDWLLIDTEHAPTEVPMIVDQLRTLEAFPATTPIVRPAWNDLVLIKRILDLGVQTLLVPYVQSAEEARRAVAATRYPPEGIRGIAATIRANRYGRIKDYHAQANREMCVLVQLETGAPLSELEAIAAVEGVDGLFIGPVRPRRRSRLSRQQPRIPRPSPSFADACAAREEGGHAHRDPCPRRGGRRAATWRWASATSRWAATSACSATRRSNSGRRFTPKSG